jgi:hypothetical protein
MEDLDGTQTRQLVDTEQVYLAYREARRELRRSYSGSMSWKKVGERVYLYKKNGGDWKSVGPRESRTEQIYERFHQGRDRLRARIKSLDAQIAKMAPVNRAMRLGRIPLVSARLLRRLEREQLLGRGIRVAGTNALYAYERMGGVQFRSDALTTMDIDLLYDARGTLDLTGTDIEEGGLLALLRKTDPTFTPLGAGSFRAANDKGFMVDLITPSARNPATRSFKDRLGTSAEDLVAAEIEGLSWLESSPSVEQIVIDERGFPLTLIAPDPRAFAMHKLWVAQRFDRDPLKARRDSGQAKAVIQMIVTRLPHLRLDDPALQAIPEPVRRAAAKVAADVAHRGGIRDNQWDES